MEDLRQQLTDNPQAAVTFATTEHFNLQTERAATIGEANGRASIFLGSVSAGLIALGFAAQGDDSVATMRAFALVLFPVLAFLGLSTFERVLQVSIEDLALGIRINRIRRFYLEAAPGLHGWLAPAPTADTFQAAVRSLGLKPRPGQVLLTVAGAISIVNSALAGVWVAMAVSLLPGPAGVPVLVGLAAMVGAACGQHRYQLRRREAAPAPFASTTRTALIRETCPRAEPAPYREVARSLGRGWGRGRRRVLPAGSWLWRMDASSRSRPALEGRSSFQ